MHTHFASEEIAYTGRELSSHWIYRRFDLLGDAVVSFIGPCDVPVENLVDLEDVQKNDPIFSRQMLHFIIEIFGMSLREGVALQRLFISQLQDRINQTLSRLAVERYGDDLYYQNTKKLSVSICTLSPTSVLIHTGLNIDATGAPVEAAGLVSELKMEDIQAFATDAMRALAEEVRDMALCCCKVRAVS